MFEMNILMKVLNSLDVIVGETQPCEKIDLLESFNSVDVVTGQVEYFQMMKLAHLEHPPQLVVDDGELKHKS